MKPYRPEKHDRAALHNALQIGHSVWGIPRGKIVPESEWTHGVYVMDKKHSQKAVIAEGKYLRDNRVFVYIPRVQELSAFFEASLGRKTGHLTEMLRGSVGYLEFHERPTYVRITVLQGAFKEISGAFLTDKMKSDHFRFREHLLDHFFNTVPGNRPVYLELVKDLQVPWQTVRKRQATQKELFFAAAEKYGFHEVDLKLAKNQRPHAEETDQHNLVLVEKN